MDDSVVVVDKPSSIPVHPCGRYRHNSILFMLKREHGFKDLHVVHRLDRLTSGVLIFARTPQAARALELQIRGRMVQKEYICRVRGEFPEGIVDCNEPVKIFNHKLGLCSVDRVEGKNRSLPLKELPIRMAKVLFDVSQILAECIKSESIYNILDFPYPMIPCIQEHSGEKPEEGVE
eukprot:Sdes_comp20668_c1_seq1m16014